MEEDERQALDMKQESEVGSVRALMGAVIDEAAGLRRAFWPSKLSIDPGSLQETRRRGSNTT